jgi:hypothetical protein
MKFDQLYALYHCSRLDGGDLSVASATDALQFLE